MTMLVLTLLHATPTVLSQVRSSSNFQMERDTLNTAGGFGTSTNFRLESSVGEDAAGRSTSTTFALQAGFQQQDTVTLSLSGGDAVVMDTAIGGITGGVSNGSTSVVATTDGAAGYSLTIVATTDPLLQSGSDTIADYVPAGAPADAAFLTASGDAHLGFSPFGADTSARFLVSGSVCGSGSASSTACWDGLSTAPVTIASAAGANAPAGVTTTVFFRVGLGTSVTQAPGTYVGTTTITLQSL